MEKSSLKTKEDVNGKNIHETYINTIEAELENAEKKNNELVEIIGRQETEINERRKYILQLEQDFFEAKSALEKEMEKASNELQKNKKDIKAEKRSLVNSLNEKIEELNATIKQKNAEIDEAKKENHKILNSLEMDKKEISAANKKIQHLETVVEKLKENIAASPKFRRNCFIIGIIIIGGVFFNLIYPFIYSREILFISDFLISFGIALISFPQRNRVVGFISFILCTATALFVFWILFF